jgi:DNA (cytosine-5)-methyltransferase 1
MRSVELFAGAGGLGIGVSRAGFKPVAVIEWDRYSCDTLRENQQRRLEPIFHWPLIEGDVRDFDFYSLGGNVEFLSAGPPCQPFSICGKHRGHRDNRDMFPQAIRAVRELQPRAVMIENVRGLARPAFANYFEYIRLQLAHPELVARSGEDWNDHHARLKRHHEHGQYRGLRYDVDFRVLNAADYGVAQKRYRVFIVGFRSDLGINWAFPEPTHSRDALLWSQWRTDEYWDLHKVSARERQGDSRARSRAERLDGPPTLLPWRAVRDAIADLPDPERHPIKAKQYLNHRFQPGARSYPGHTGSPLDEPAKALKAGDHGVPGGENMLRRPDGSVRYFSVRESARLQAFPDDFLFHGSWSETMRQLGNAVPVTLAEVVATNIRRHLEPMAVLAAAE